MDYATPKLYCTTKDGKCTTFDYVFPKDSLKLDVQGDEGEPRPSFLTNPSVKVKYLKDGVNVVDLEGDHLFCLSTYLSHNMAFLSFFVLHFQQFFIVAFSTLYKML